MHLYDDWVFYVFNRVETEEVFFAEAMPCPVLFTGELLLNKDTYNVNYSLLTSKHVTSRVEITNCSTYIFACSSRHCQLGSHKPDETKKN